MTAPSCKSEGAFYLDFVFLSQDFYSAHSACPEIEQKTDRPYVRVCVK